MDLYSKPDYTEAYIGIGQMKNEALKIKFADYTVYGLFGSFIDQNAENMALGVGNAARAVLQ